MWKVIAIALLFSAIPASTQAALPGGDDKSTVFVECSRSSAFVHILVKNHRRIGNVVLEVKDLNGRTLYREEGKALSDELVRRLDKGVFPRGEHTLTVSARDLNITQRFSIE
jgi:hypothetical protein